MSSWRPLNSLLRGPRSSPKGSLVAGRIWSQWSLPSPTSPELRVPLFGLAPAHSPWPSKVAEADELPRSLAASQRYTPSSSSTGSMISTRSKLGLRVTFRRGEQPSHEGREEATTRWPWSSCSRAGGSLSTRHNRRPRHPPVALASGSSWAVKVGLRGASAGRAVWAPEWPLPQLEWFPECMTSGERTVFPFLAMLGISGCGSTPRTKLTSCPRHFVFLTSS